MYRFFAICTAVASLFFISCENSSAWAQAAAPAEEPKSAGDAPEVWPFGEPKGAIALSKTERIWIDLKRKWVILDGEVCTVKGQLEMFACPRGTKEYESIVSVVAKSQVAHAGLLAVGAKTGTTVKFDPKYEPATGPVVDVIVLWRDEKGKDHKARAQEWIKMAKTGKEMDYDWVFAGSSFYIDDETKKRFYRGDQGDFICVSNFTSATLDLPVASTQANADLLFEAFTDRIPPKGTKVRLLLIPRLDEAKGPPELKDLPTDAPAEKKEAAPAK